MESYSTFSSPGCKHISCAFVTTWLASRAVTSLIDSVKRFFLCARLTNHSCSDTQSTPRLRTSSLQKTTSTSIHITYTVDFLEKYVLPARGRYLNHVSRVSPL